MNISRSQPKRPVGIMIVVAILVLRAATELLGLYGGPFAGWSTIDDPLVLSILLGFRVDLWFAGSTLVFNLLAAAGVWWLKRWGWYLAMVMLVLGAVVAGINQHWLYAVVQVGALIYMMRSRVTALFGVGSF